MSNRLDYFKKINSRTWLNNPNSGVIETPPPEKSFMDTVTDVAENVTNGIDNNIRWVSNKLHKDDVDYSSTGKDYLSGTNSYNASDTTANTFPGNGEINNDKLSNHTIEIPEKIKQFYKIPEDVKKLYNMSPIGLLGGLAYQATALDKSLSNKIIDDGKNYVNESTAPTWLKNFQEANLNALKNTQEYNYNVPKSFINGLSNVYGGISDLFGLDSGNELNYVREKTNPNKSFSGKIFSKEFFTDPEGLTYTLPNAIGSMVALAPSAYLAPSYLIKLIQSTSNPMIKQAAELALRGAMTAFPESMAEGGSVVRESKENNLNNPYLRGWATTMSNLPMLMASNAAEYTLLGGKGINPLYGKTLPNRLAKATMATGANAVQNGAEEFIQQGIQNKWTDKDYSFNPLNAPQDQIDAMQTGIIVGGGISATPSLIRATTGNPDFDKYINNASKETNVPADIIKEVGNVESSGNPNAVSNQGAVGYMQLMPSTAEAMGVKDITDPEQNIMGGAKYLKYLYDKYGNWKDTLIAYNEGEGNFDNGKRFSESIEYANKILDNIDDKNIINLPDKKYYNILDEVSDTGLTELTEQKLNLLARDFYKKFGYNLDVTSMKRNGDGSSWHDSGQAIDVVSDILENEPEARAWIIEQGKKYGLTSLDEYTNPSANATGGHIHFSDHGDPLPGISEKNISTPSLSNNTDYTINNDLSNMQADDITLYEPVKTGQNDTSNLENLSEDEKWDILDEEIEKTTNSDIDYLDKLTKIKVNKDIPALDNLINKIKTTDKKFLTKIQAKRGKTFTEEQKSQIDLATKELEQLYSENKFLEAMKKAEDIEYMKKGFVADNTFKTNTTIKPKADTNEIKTLGYDLLKQLQKRNIELSNTNNVVNYDKIKSALASNDINKQKDALTVMQYILNLLKKDKKTINPSTLSNDNFPIKDISTTGIIQQEPKEIDIESAKNIGEILYNKVQEKQLKVDLNNLEKDIRSNDIKKINKANNFMQKKLDKTLSNEEKQQIKKETLIYSKQGQDIATISSDSAVRLSQSNNKTGVTEERLPISVKSNVSSTNIIPNDNISDNQNESEVNENELNDSSNPMASRDKQRYNKNNVGTDDESHRSSREDGRDIRTNGEDGSRQDSSTSIRRNSTNSGGKTSNSTIRQEKSSNLDNSTRDTKLSRSITDSYERPLANETTAKTITQPANESSINERNLNKQKQVNNQNIKVGNLESIKNDLPLLLPEQQDDVFKTETRMFVNNKPGMLFTNGTGTGKTFTGLGIIKRFINMGKNNILIVSPGTGINSSWIESGKKFFNLNIVPLKNKKDNGGNNIVITTLNNFTSNKTLVKRAWDLIIIDESHKLISNQNNKETGAIKNLRAITLHDRGFSTRFDNLYDEEFEKIHHLEESLKKDKNIITKSEETAIKEQITDLKGNLSNIREQDYKKWERIDEKDKPKVLFLSATPFSHVKNIDYAEGYLFKYDKKEDNGGYGQPTAQEDFLIQNFGYRMRYGRLEQPDADVDNSIMEINFCEKLKKDGALSNRRLIIDKDYDRGFILIDGGIGKKVDEGFEYLFNSKNNYQLLANFLNKNYDYYSKLFLLEAIKARESIKLIKEYQKTGKKIVVFHRYLKNESKHPFKLFFTDEQEKSMTPTTKRRLENEYERFCKERPDLVNLDLSELTSPIQTLQNAFGNKIAIYNGKLSAKEKDINLAKFIVMLILFWYKLMQDVRVYLYMIKQVNIKEY